jgi:hypothetical protein
MGYVAHARFLLVPTAATGRLTSTDCCYYHPQWRRATWHQLPIAIDPHSSDWLAVQCFWIASSDRLVVCCYWTTSSDGLSDINDPSLLDYVVVMG